MNHELIKLRRIMRSVQQNSSQNLIEHGFAVARYFKDLHDHVILGKPLKYVWNLPAWVHAPELWLGIPPLQLLYRYQIYHDCGKTRALLINSSSETLFPNHAEHSKEIWHELFGNDLAGDLMLHDMDIHTMAASDVEWFVRLPYAGALTLTGLAEIHANANSFGGLYSISFKSKWKHIDRRAKKIILSIKNKKV